MKIQRGNALKASRHESSSSRVSSTSTSISSPSIIDHSVQNPTINCPIDKDHNNNNDDNSNTNGNPSVFSTLLSNELSDDGVDSH